MTFLTFDLVGSWASITSLLVFTIFLYPVTTAIYNLYFHPLARRFPGPKLWAASRLPFVYNLITGKLVHRQREIHEKYGEIVRLAPDEVSFANEQSYNDIYTFRRGHGRAPRDKIFAAASNGDVDNIGTTTDPKFHGRVRGLLSHSFTQDALRSQYPIIQHHADTLVAQLKKRAQTPAKPSDHAVINITDWLNYFTMDVIGDLAFGEPFGCLAKGEYHDWVRTLFMYLEYLTLSGVPRYYPLLERLLRMLLPKSVVEGQLKHERYAHERINKRLDSNTSRNDFMSAFMNKNPDFSVMSRKEILSTFNIIIVAGGETTATVLTGIFSHLALNAPVRRRLCEEIRSAFTNEDDITIDATKELKYLDAVLNESLRICNPISSGLPRTVPPGGDTYCGVYLPEGTHIGARTYAINRSKKYFHNPDTFVPERWLPLSERPKEYANDCLSASLPFSVGFHSCLGRPLALVELRLVMCRLLWMFDFESVPGEEIRFDDFPITMIVQKGPVPLRIKVREGADIG